MCEINNTETNNALNDFKKMMEETYLKGLRESPTFSEEMHKCIEEEFQKLYKSAEEFYATNNKI